VGGEFRPPERTGNPPLRRKGDEKKGAQHARKKNEMKKGGLVVTKKGVYEEEEIG